MIRQTDTKTAFHPTKLKAPNLQIPNNYDTKTEWTLTSAAACHFSTPSGTTKIGKKKIVSPTSRSTRDQHAAEWTTVFSSGMVQLQPALHCNLPEWLPLPASNYGGNIYFTELRTTFRTFYSSSTLFSVNVRFTLRKPIPFNTKMLKVHCREKWSRLEYSIPFLQSRQLPTVVGPTGHQSGKTGIAISPHLIS